MYVYEPYLLQIGFITRTPRGRMATEKAYISTAMPTYSVVNNDAFEIEVAVKEFTARNIEVGQKVYITGDAFDGTTYNGVVKSISPIATKNNLGQSNQTEIYTPYLLCNFDKCSHQNSFLLLLRPA